MVRVKNIAIIAVLYALTVWILWAALFFEQTKTAHPYATLVISIFVAMLIVKYVKAFVFMLIAPWYRIQKLLSAKHSAGKTYAPLVSVIIPAYNEEVGIIQTIRTLLASKYKNLEIIVVNDGSTDGSDALLRAFQRTVATQTVDAVQTTPSIAFRYFYKKNGGKGRALNYGLARANGEIIITIDADCAVTPTTIGNFVDAFADPSVSAAVGNVKIGNTNNIYGLIQHLEFLFSFYFKQAESVLGIIYIIGGAAGAFRRDVFDQLGVFDHETITEDIDLSVRIQKAGLKIVYVDDAVVYTEGASTLSGLLKQRLRWKQGWFQTMYANRAIILSLDKRHNKLLSWFLIPFVYFGNFQLTFEPLFVIFLYIYATTMNDFTSFITWILVEFCMFIVLAVFGGRSYRKVYFLLLAPIAWLMFHVMTYIEYRALVGSIKNMLLKRKVVWQKWNRQGMDAVVEQYTI